MVTSEPEPNPRSMSLRDLHSFAQQSASYSCLQCSARLIRVSRVILVTLAGLTEHETHLLSRAVYIISTSGRLRRHCVIEHKSLGQNPPALRSETVGFGERSGHGPGAGAAGTGAAG